MELGKLTGVRGFVFLSLRLCKVVIIKKRSDVMKLQERDEAKAKCKTFSLTTFRGEICAVQVTSSQHEWFLCRISGVAVRLRMLGMSDERLHDPGHESHPCWASLRLSGFRMCSTPNRLRQTRGAQQRVKGTFREAADVSWGSGLFRESWPLRNLLVKSAFSLGRESTWENIKKGFVNQKGAGTHIYRTV